MEPTSPPFTPIKPEAFQSLDYAILDQHEMEFMQQEELDPAQLFLIQGKTFDWPSPAVRRQLAQQKGTSPGNYFQLRCQRLGGLGENVTPNKRPAFYSPAANRQQPEFP